MLHRRAILGSAAAASLFSPAIVRAQSAGLKVALMSTLSGPGAALGNQIRDGWLLGVKHRDGKLGGLATETLVIDDELKPDGAVTKATAAIERDKVDILAGLVFSNIMAAIARPVVESETFLISANAGPSLFAGKGCNPFLFVASYQNDQPHAAMGQVAQDQGYKRVFILVPNYQAGKDSAAGFKSRFKGEIVDEVYVPLNQLDFTAEVTKIAAAKPDALFTFMPGGLGINLVRAYRQAGLTVPFLSCFTVDESTLPAHGDAAVGLFTASTWAPDFKNDASQGFVHDFEAAYGYVPGSYAAHAYDVAMLVDAALKQAGGKSDKAAFRVALEKAQFASVRGNFHFGANHFPVEDFYLCKAIKRPDGKYATATERKVLSNDPGPYAAECRMA
jgi:branched-chain amino acid transport system substrate-binding protein